VEKVKKFFRELLGIAGFCLATYGIFLMHPPTACVISGSIIFWLTTPTKKSVK